ncbi:unnamed protein product [Paramecium sonneborni]|uniref:EGF-like domain-containing protein n=1 Tax=Paramecium sonneborni TaxID=65129 RepID=A0A8S1R4K5_9CILI|nr:unnamed protein product [Paramecium sonneborni]
MFSLFSYFLCLVISSEILFLSLDSEYDILQISNLILPLKLEDEFGTNQENNIYFYDVNANGISSKSDIFSIGIWIKTNVEKKKQFIMSINEDSVVIELSPDESADTLKVHQGSGIFRTEIQNTWIYTFYLQLEFYISQWICLLNFSAGYDPLCKQLDGEDYSLFSFLQPTSNQNNQYQVDSWQQDAISITAKVLNISPDIICKNYNNLITTTCNPINNLIISNYIELNVILDLKLYERIQTKILKDWSDNQHIVKIGSIQNPLIIPSEQLLSFSSNQYIKIENFKISKTITIEFQLFDDNLTDEVTLFVFQSQKLAQDLLTINANFDTRELSIILNAIPIEVCSVNFGNKFIISIINGIITTQFLIIENDIQRSLFTKEVIIQLQDVDTLIIGNKYNININPFRLSNIRISNGFYFVLKQECGFSINQCYYCFNNNYLHQGQCLSQCPSNFEKNELRKECIPKCHSTCLTCDPSNLSYCLTCSGIRINQPNCNCPIGYFDDGISPNCIKYFPDLTVEGDIYEGDCLNVPKEIKFTKLYRFPPLVAISLLGYIGKDPNQDLRFKIYADYISNISFFLQAICSDPNVYFKIQWVSGYRSRFLNVNSFEDIPQKEFIVSIEMDNQFEGSILGWNIRNIDKQDILLNLEKQSDSNTFNFSSNLSLDNIFYQLFEFRNYVYNQISLNLNLQTQGKDFSIGGTYVNVNIEQIPLSIPSLTTLQQYYNQNSGVLQFYIKESKRFGQMRYSIKLQGQKTIFPNLESNVIIFAFKCNNQNKPCDYLEELQKCHVILEDCECSSSQYYNYIKNYCVDCSDNCLTCDQHYTNCLTCPSQYNYTLQQDQVTLYNYCGCNKNQFKDSNGICQDCDSMCFTCEQTKTRCKSCIEPQFLNEFYECKCKPGYIATQFGCEQCISDQCSICQDKNQCIQQCDPYSQLNVVTKKCECQFGYYDDDQQCQACNEPCLSCISTTICLSCITTMYFDQFNCYKCEPPCYECNSQISCINCIDQSYILDGDQCLLRDHFNSIIKECQKDYYYVFRNTECVQICGDYLVPNNVQCYDPNTIKDNCNINLLNTNCICNQLNECTFYDAPQLILTYQNITFNKQYISITFNQQVKVYTSLPLSQEFQFEILNISNQDFNYTLHILQDTNQEVHFVEYILELQINRLLDYRPIFKLIVNQIVGNQQDLLLQQNQYFLTLMFPQYLNEQQESYSFISLKANQLIIYILPALSLISLSIGFQYLLLECLFILQYQQYLRYINQNYPYNLLIFFQLSEIISLQPLLEFIHFDDLFEFLGLNQEKLFIEGKFKLYPQNANLLQNFQIQFFQFLIGLLIWISIKYLKKILYYYIFNQRFFNFIHKLYPYINSEFVLKITLKLYNFFLSFINLGKFMSLKGVKQILLLNGWDIIFKILIFTKVMDFSDILNIIQAIISFVILLCYLIIILTICEKNSQLIPNIIQQLKHINEIAQVIRTILFLFILVYFQDSGMLQIKFICIICLFSIGLLFSHRKIYKKSQFIIQLVVELSVLIFTLTATVYSNDFVYLFEEETKIIFGWCHIFILSVVIIAEFFHQVIQIIGSLYQKFKHTQQKKIEKTKPRVMFIEL